MDFEKTEEENKGIFKGLCENLQKILDEDIKEVRVSSRLKDSPCCLVTSEDAMSAQMERMMKAMGQKNLPKSKRILEINPTHPICEMLKKKAEANEDLGDWPKALYGQALLAEGSPLPNPAEYVAAVTRLLGQAAGK